MLLTAAEKRWRRRRSCDWLDYKSEGRPGSRSWAAKGRVGLVSSRERRRGGLGAEQAVRGIADRRDTRYGRQRVSLQSGPAAPFLPARRHAFLCCSVGRFPLFSDTWRLSVNSCGPGPAGDGCAMSKNRLGSLLLLGLFWHAPGAAAGPAGGFLLPAPPSGGSSSGGGGGSGATPATPYACNASAMWRVSN